MSVGGCALIRGLATCAGHECAAKPAQTVVDRARASPAVHALVANFLDVVALHAHQRLASDERPAFTD